MIFDDDRKTKKISKLEKKISDIQYELSVWGWTYSGALKEAKIAKVAKYAKKIEELRD